MSRGGRNAGLLLLLLLGWLAPPPAGARPSEEVRETERFVKARIEIPEFMQGLMRREGGPERFRPGGGRRPSMEEMRKMTGEINAAVDGVLERHGLTVEEFQEWGPEIFRDTERLEALFREQPDLRPRWEAVPEEGMGVLGGGPRR